MDPDNAQSNIPAPPLAESAAGPASATRSEPIPSDPEALVAQMVAVGPWPEPELLEKIVQAGDAVVPPLIAVMRTYPRGWPAEAPLDHAVGLLSVIRPPRAIPELIEILRRYPSDSGEVTAHAIGSYGAIGFDPVLELLRDPAVRGYARQNAIFAARITAGDDPVRRARLAEVLRFFLADAIDRGREQIRESKLAKYGADSSAETVDETSGTDESATEPEDSVAASSNAESTRTDGNLEPSFYEEIAFLISDLAALADPSARNLINTAFDEDLVEAYIVDKASVDEQYQEGGAPAPRDLDWLDHYRQRYQEYIEYRNRPRIPPPVEARLPDEPEPEPEDAPLLSIPETIRNVGPKLGRNDPCWCGSGKKYKKCHLGKDRVT